MQIDKKKIKRYSTIGARPTLGRVLQELAKEDRDIMVLVADVSTSAGLERFKKSLPEQFLDVGIAEQNMMAVATGLAKEGFKVVTTTFAPFQSMRCLEQIRVNQGYMGMPIVMVGLTSGVYHSYLGNTHCCFEDGAILRSIPDMTVISPANGAEIAKALEASIGYGKPVYIRLPENKGLPVIHEDDFDFEIGKGIRLRDGEDVALIANGTMVETALKVADILDEKGFSSLVVDMHTMKPLDAGLLDRLKPYPLLVTIEEHSVIGGLGFAVAEYYAPYRERPQHILFGIKDFYPHAGEYAEALGQCGLLPEQIADELEKKLGCGS